MNHVTISGLDGGWVIRPTPGVLHPGGSFHSWKEGWSGGTSQKGHQQKFKMSLSVSWHRTLLECVCIFSLLEIQEKSFVLTV